MSKIILESMKTESTINTQSSLIRNIIETKKLVHLKTVNNIPYIYIGNKKLNKLISTVNGETVESFTTLQQIEKPELNIQDLELTIIE